MTEDKKWTLPEDPRQRINLSKYALFVLENDLLSYGNDMGRSEFICTILKNYSRRSAAVLKPEKAFILKGEAFNIRVSRDVEELLYNELPQEDPDLMQVYRTAGALIKTILEEFFRLSAAERERIEFKDTIDFFSRMIEEKCAVRINNKTNAFVIRPYKFVVDPGTGYNYLIGFSRPSRTDAAHDRPVSRRLSALTGSLLPITSISGKITREEADRLEERLKNVLPAYFMEDNEDIVAAFTDEGLKRLKSISYSRPLMVSKDDNQQASADGKTYIRFFCTESQAQNYFVRLGSEVEIISPQTLRRKMRKYYKDGLNTYQQDGRKN